MREFFSGWKRKLGVVALVGACVFMAGWARSLVVGDQVAFGDTKDVHWGTLLGLAMAVAAIRIWVWASLRRCANVRLDRSLLVNRLPPDCCLRVVPFLETTTRQNEGSAVKEFFKGWQRKVGCVTLVMACVFTVGWLRAIRGGESLIYARSDLPSRIKAQSTLACFGIASIDQAVFLLLSEKAEWPAPHEWRWKDLEWETFPNQYHDPDVEGTRKSFSSCRGCWAGCGFIFGTRVVEAFNLRVTAFIIPYWFITLSLTLLSAYLLLRKPRPAKPDAQQST